MTFRCFFLLNVIMLNLTLGLPQSKCSFLCLPEKKEETSPSIITHLHCALLLTAQKICYTFVILRFKMDDMDNLNAALTNIHCNAKMCFNVRVFILSRHLLFERLTYRNLTKLFNENFNFTVYSLNFLIGTININSLLANTQLSRCTVA